MKRGIILVFGVLVLIASSCTKYDAPTLTAPGNTEVQVGLSTDLTFNFTADAGFTSSSIVATGGTATVKTNGTEGASTGTVVVTFNASTKGAGSVTLTITDSEDMTISATAVLNVVEEQMIFEITENISENTTWETGKIYILTTRITVLSGVTLTIQPGVIVKGEAGTGANATALIIARGAKIMAEGSASAPIVFTSVADAIEPGQVESPSLEPTLNGLWGGLIVLGNAPISADAESVQIEGIPASDPNGLYGGTDPADNSGVLKYISIRHGGANIGEGNEINGLTLGGVGNGTVIENIEIVSNQDDGIEWFGGTVNVSNVIVWNTGDDAIDCDQNYNGTIDNFVIITPGDECFELDGPEGYAATANFTIKNGTVQATAGDRHADGLVDNDPNTNVNMMNVYFFDLTVGQDFDELPTEYYCTFSGLEAVIPDGSTVADFFKKGSDAFTTSVTKGSNTVGADLSKFAGWSWASVSGALNF